MKSVLDITIRDGEIALTVCILLYCTPFNLYTYICFKDTAVICHTRIQGEGRKGEGVRIPPLLKLRKTVEDFDGLNDN